MIACVLAGGILTGNIGAAQTEMVAPNLPSRTLSGDEYLRALESAIWSHWFPPQSMKEHQIATVTFILNAAGRLEDIRLETATRNIAANKAAIWAVESAKKIYAAKNNPPPEGAVRLRFRFSYGPQPRNKLKLTLLERLPDQVKRKN